MNNVILTQLKTKFKYTNISNDFVVFANEKNADGSLIPLFMCSKEGTYAYERGGLIQISGYHDIYKNLISLFAVLTRKMNLDFSKIRFLLNSNNQNEISKIFVNEYGSDFQKYISFNSTEFVDDTLNVKYNDQFYSIDYVLGDKYCVITPETKFDLKSMYKDLFLEIGILKDFKENVLTKIDVQSFEKSFILELYGIFKYRKNVPIFDIEKKNNYKL